MAEQPASVICASMIIDQLVAGGVAEVVLAPGSRSAPLAYQVFAADRKSRLRLHVRIDERSAGFLALGLAKASGRPVAVITTSGTAVGNLVPATMEASHSGVPLIMISADRPVSMIGTGANQTTDQARLLERFLRAHAHLDAAALSMGSWQFQVGRLIAAASGSRSHQPGPVQLNIAFEEPLIPIDGVGKPATQQPSPRIEPITPQRAVVNLPTGPATVVVAGDARPEVGEAARAVAARGRLPLLAEPSSHARGAAEAISSYRLLLSGTLATQIERVIVFGHPTLSRPVQALLGRRDVELIMVADGPNWIDPATAADRVVDAVSLDAAEEIWLRRWLTADSRLQAALHALLAKEKRLTGPAVAAALWHRLGADDVLFVGSSNPIRDLDLAPGRAAVPRVFANRGLAGIDGSVSTAIGVALATRRPSHALLGDLTFVHDSNGLVIGPDEPRPDLRIVIANDDGGSIFATLEQGAPALAEPFERVFGTPHGTDLGALAASCDLPFIRVTTPVELDSALASPPVGIEVVEAVVDRQHRRELDQAIKALAELAEA